MIVYPLPLRPSGREIEIVIRLERAIARLGTPLGYDGDPLAERFPAGRTLRDLSDAHRLMRSLPVELRNWDRRVALKMCQAAVFGRTRLNARNLPPQPTSKASADAKLARERNRKPSRRASA